jgi:hypothetical protein
VQHDAHVTAYRAWIVKAVAKTPARRTAREQDQIRREMEELR